MVLVGVVTEVVRRFAAFVLLVACVVAQDAKLKPPPASKVWSTPGSEPGPRTVTDWFQLRIGTEPPWIMIGAVLAWAKMRLVPMPVILASKTRLPLAKDSA